jgi:hypothetical protein
MAKLIRVSFERPYNRERDTTVEWDFVAEFDEEHVLNGDGFGGRLRRIDTTSGKAWVASHGERYTTNGVIEAGITGEPGLTREIAIEHLQPLVYEAYVAHKAEYAAREAEWRRRGTLAQELCKLLPAGFRVFASGDIDSPVDTPLVFKISVDKLTEADVRSIAARLK